MISFIILESNTIYIRKIENIINKFMMDNKYSYEIKMFKNNSIDNIIEDSNNKIYIINSKLSNKVINKIRECDWNSTIIVLKDDINSIFNYKRLQILDTILIDDYLENNLLDLLKISIKSLSLKDNIIIKKKSCLYRLCSSEILYFYKKDRKVLIVNNSKIYQINESLKNLKELLGDNFIQVHKSCYVNKNKVFKIDFKNDLIIFDNGISIDMLSKKYRKNITFN